MCSKISSRCECYRTHASPWQYIFSFSKNYSRTSWKEKTSKWKNIQYILLILMRATFGYFLIQGRHFHPKAEIAEAIKACLSTIQRNGWLESFNISKIHLQKGGKWGEILWTPLSAGNFNLHHLAVPQKFQCDPHIWWIGVSIITGLV